MKVNLNIIYLRLSKTNKIFSQLLIPIEFTFLCNIIFIALQVFLDKSVPTIN